MTNMQLISTFGCRSTFIKNFTMHALSENDITIRGELMRITFNVGRVTVHQEYNMCTTRKVLKTAYISVRGLKNLLTKWFGDTYRALQVLY